MVTVEIVFMVESAIPVIDLLPAFQQLPPNVLDGYRTDPIHPNAAGHRMIAEVVARHLR